MTITPSIPGYSYGHVAQQSPVSLADLELLKQTTLFTADDATALKEAGAILLPQAEAILDVWYGFVGSNAHLVQYFAAPGAAPNAEYLGAVRKRFAQWIDDTCNRPYDQTWLDYQHEIALRHHSIRKNKTDQVIAAPIIHQRYLTAFVVPLTLTIRPFLAKGATSDAQVDRMYNAWFKAITLTAILWSYPYVKDHQF